MGLRSALLSRLPWRRRGTRTATRRGAANWWSQARAPRFRVDPVVDSLPGGQTVHLLMTFQQLRGPDVEAGLQARWRGGGLGDAFTTPMLDIREHTYQMKPSIADPDATSDAEIPPQHLGFELRFQWQGRERHGLWIWPVQQKRNGSWVLHTTAANTDIPARAW